MSLFCKHYSCLTEVLVTNNSSSSNSSNNSSNENDGNNGDAGYQSSVVQMFYRNPPNWNLMERYLSEYPYRYMKNLLNYSLEREAPVSMVMKIVEQYPHVIVSESNNDGLSCLHLACMTSKSTPIVRAILQANPSLASHQSSNHRRLPLHHAQTVEIAQLLLTVYPAGILTPDVQGCYPLHCACQNPQSTLDLIQYLIQQGRQQGLPNGGVLLPTNNGTYPFQFIQRHYHQLLLLQTNNNNNDDEKYSHDEASWNKLIFMAKHHLLYSRLEKKETNHRQRSNSNMGLSGLLFSSFRANNHHPDNNLSNQNTKLCYYTTDYTWKPQHISVLHAFLLLQCPIPIISYAIQCQPESLIIQWNGRAPLNLITAKLFPKHPKYSHDVIQIMLQLSSSTNNDNNPNNEEDDKSFLTHKVSMQNFILEGCHKYKQSLYHILDHCDNHNDQDGIIFGTKIVNLLVQHDTRVLEISEYHTRLYPFMYAASSTYYKEEDQCIQEKQPAPISLIYHLLRQAPWSIQYIL